jgi:membrane fusion protein (multidrug efflux system)
MKKSPPPPRSTLRPCRRHRALPRLAVAVLFALATSTGCRSSVPAALPASSEAEAPEVTFATVETAAVQRQILLPAELRAWQEVTLHARVAGYVRTIAVDRGDRVKTGDLVAELEAPELASDVAMARANAALAARLSGRVGKAHGSAPDLVVAQSVDDAGAKLEVARAELARAETLLSFATIRAPFDGVVTERFVDPGAFVPAAVATSLPQTAAVVRLADFSRIRVAVPVPEAEAVHVRVGTRAGVRVDEAGTAPLAATVSRISWSLERDTRTMMAEVDLDNSGLGLRPGMLAHVRLSVEEHPSVPAVPASAVLREKAGTFVFLLGEDNRVRKTPVRTGFVDDALAEVLEGVEAGVRIALPSKSPLRDGMVVRPRKSP